jgi:hypothetical protein
VEGNFTRRVVRFPSAPRENDARARVPRLCTREIGASTVVIWQLNDRSRARERLVEAGEDDGLR